MRKGGGKSKGGSYERVVISQIAKAFSSLGVGEDDIFRTKNSGSTKAQPGDVQFSPKMAKLFPVLVECKHYKTVKYKLGMHLSSQAKSAPIYQWWLQVEREQKEKKDKFGILVFRQNNCTDLVAVRVEHYQSLLGRMPNWQEYSWSMFTMWKKQSIVIIPSKEFFTQVVNKIKEKRIISKRDKAK